MPLVNLTKDEIELILLMICVDTNDGEPHPDHDALYEKLEKASDEK